MRTIQRDIVGAFIFSNDDQILLGKNGNGGVYQDLWVVPGGGIDVGESQIDAVRREVMEEVGIDTTKAKVTFIDNVLYGQSEKTLRDTGETVLVDMTFYNFKIDFDLPANEIPIVLTDDLGEAEWIPFDRLKSMQFSPTVKQMLQYLNCL